MAAVLVMPTVEVTEIRRAIDFSMTAPGGILLPGETPPETGPVTWDLAFRTTQPAFSADLSMYDAFVIRIAAGAGQRFSVQYHSAYPETFAVVARWGPLAIGDSGNDFATLTPSVAFEGFTGTEQPVLFNHSEIATDSSSISANFSCIVTESFEFDALTITLPYDPTTLTAGTLDYAAGRLKLGVAVPGLVTDPSTQFLTLVPEPTDVMVLLAGMAAVTRRRPRS